MKHILKSALRRPDGSHELDIRIIDDDMRNLIFSFVRKERHLGFVSHIIDDIVFLHWKETCMKKYDDLNEFQKNINRTLAKEHLADEASNDSFFDENFLIHPFLIHPYE